MRFLLDLEPPSIRYREELLEQEIRLAYTLAGRCIWENIPVSLASNGRDVITGKEVEIPSGSSERHLGSIGETLARVSLPLKPGPFWELLRQERLGMSAQPSGEDIAFCLISSGQSDALLKEAEALSQQCGGLFWICILDPEVERKPIPAGIHFVPVQY